MDLWLAFCTALLLMITQYASAARLVVVPLASDSHILAFTALTTELERLGGHEIHMVVSDALAEAAKNAATARHPNHNHHHITYPFRFEVFADDMAKIAKANPIVAMHYGYKVMCAMTEMVIGNQHILQKIRNLKPDVIIGDATASYGHWLTAKLGIPSIEFDVGTSSGMLHAGQFGGQINPAYIPATGTMHPSTGMSLYQRCSNVAHLVATKVMMYLHKNLGPVRSMAKRQGVKHLPGQGPYKPLLLLVNFDWSLEPPRPIAPSTKYVGTLMPRPPKQLPNNILNWLEDPNSSLPVVYISFGASFLAPEAAIPAVAAALAATKDKMRFLLRMRQQEHEMMADAWKKMGVAITDADVLVTAHVPQNDMLGHSRVAAFVTQGGYLSMQEAAYHGVPIIGVPLMIGHNELVNHAQDHGRGILVPKEGLMAGKHEALTAALLEVLTNSKYKQQAAITSSRLKAHPLSPGQRATNWVNYALAAAPEHGSFLHTQGQDMYWWQVILLDVLGVYAALLALLLLLLRQVLQMIGRAIRRSSESPGRATDGQGWPGAGSSKGKSD